MAYTYNANGDLRNDGVNYTYDFGQISQQQETTSEYFLGDALGSVRQLTSQTDAVSYAASYSPDEEGR